MRLYFDANSRSIADCDTPSFISLGPEHLSLQSDLCVTFFMLQVNKLGSPATAATPGLAVFLVLSLLIDESALAAGDSRSEKETVTCSS